MSGEASPKPTPELDQLRSAFFHTVSELLSRDIDPVSYITDQETDHFENQLLAQTDIDYRFDSSKFAFDPAIKYGPDTAAARRHRHYSRLIAVCIGEYVTPADRSDKAS